MPSPAGRPLMPAPCAVLLWGAGWGALHRRTHMLPQCCVVDATIPAHYLTAQTCMLSQVLPWFGRSSCRMPGMLLRNVVKQVLPTYRK